MLVRSVALIKLVVLGAAYIRRATLFKLVGLGAAFIRRAALIKLVDLDAALIRGATLIKFVGLAAAIIKSAVLIRGFPYSCNKLFFSPRFRSLKLRRSYLILNNLRPLELLFKE